MIHKNLKLKTLYINKHSDQQTYFFMEYNNEFYGARKEKTNDWQWIYGVWSSYADPAVTEDISEIDPDELLKIQREALINIINAHNIV